MVDSSVNSTKTGVELADVVRRFGPEYTTKFGHVMMPSQKRALADIAACCTEELGGRLFRCNDCNESFWRYHCCRNRACPKCHGKQTRQWLEKRQAELLPCDYFHAVATVPSELRDTFRREQKFMYGLLMRVATEAVKELCAKKRHLGGLPGILAVLHTCNGQLGFHPHVHMLITGGGITSDGKNWEPARGEYLVPVGVFGMIFLKHYGNGNNAVLNYLSRYVFRTAISNARILAMDETHVTFRWKDSGTGTWRTMRLPGVEFLGRFLQHVLPRGFHRVRYYGLWHHWKRDLASRAWLLLILQKPTDAVAPVKIADLIEALGQLAETDDGQDLIDEGNDNADSPCCPHCGSTRTAFLGEWPRPRMP